MKQIFSNRWLLLLLRVVLGGIFLYAGSQKLMNPQGFADSISTFQILPLQLINLVVLGLPPLEMIFGLLLIIGMQKCTASLGITMLTTIFTIVLVQAMARGLKIDCGCFGSGEPSVGRMWLSLGRDMILLAAGIWLYQADSMIEHPTPESTARIPLMR